MKVDSVLASAAAQAQQASQATQTAQIQDISSSGAPKAEFANRVQEALGNLVETGQQTDHSVMQLLSGGETDLHSSMVRLGETDLQLRFMVQLRNRAIAAYEEVMRLQV
jgi:flagellar hook-basal body complex protein FliE